MEKLKQFYTTIFSVTYSSCGYYLAAASNYGSIAIFNLAPFLECDEDAQAEDIQRYPIFKFQAHSSPIYSLVSTKKLIISGSVGEIRTWKWSDVKRKEAKPVMTLPIPQGECLTKPEVNAMALSNKDNEPILFAGCGNNNVYCFNIETGTIKFVLEGHADYIHCLALGNTDQDCLSGSEDGSVRMWDTRKGGKAVHVIEPFKNAMASRPELGKWIGCLAFDQTDDWLVCGGAPTLTIWHLRSLSPSTQLLKPNVTSNVVHFYDDTIISAGSEPYINHWSIDGKLLIEVPASASSIYSISISSRPTQQVLSAAGSSYKIDVCTDFRYKDFSLLFCDK